MKAENNYNHSEIERNPVPGQARESSTWQAQGEQARVADGLNERGGQGLTSPAGLPRSVWPALGVVVALFVAVGLIFAAEPTIKLLFMGGLGVPAAVLVWRRPEFGVLMLVFLSLSFIPASVIDFRLPFGGIDLRDMSLLGLLFLGVAKHIRTRLVIPWWSVSGPLLLYFGMAIFSAIYAMLYLDVGPSWTMSELRAILFLATFFATAWTITNRRALYIVLAGLFILADLTASIVVVQQFFGRDNVLLSAMLGNGWYLRDVGGTSGGFGDVRVVPPGNVLMFMVTIVAFALLLQSSKNGRLRLFFSLQFIYLCIALLFTYTRAQWIATAMGVALIVLVLPRPDKALFARYMVGIVLVFGLVYGLFEGSIQRFLADQPFVANITDRALSIFTPEQTLETNSLEWRIFENGEALKSIEANPILGVGLGNAYRNITLLQWENRRFYFRKTRFVHNSYLYVATKMGLPGLASFFILSLSFLLNGWKVYRKLEAGTLKRIMIALLTGFVGLLFWSNSQMHLMTVESTAVIGLLLGLAASVGHIGGVPEAWAGAPEAYTASQGSSPRTLPAGVRAT